MPDAAAPPSATPHFLAAEGEMAALTRAHPWEKSALGSPARWPQSLKTAVGLCLHSRFPMLIWWGPDLVMLYNDAYRPILGREKHPAALGQSGEACWREIWPEIGPLLRAVLSGGRATWSADQLLVLERNGYPEECYFSFSFSPIHDESGGIGGVFTATTETTQRVVDERRLRSQSELSEALAGLSESGEICRAAAEVLARNANDLPFSLIYGLDASASQAQLLATSGTPPAGCGQPRLGLGSGEPLSRAARAVLESGESQTVELEASGQRLVVQPVRTGQRAVPAGLLVAGLNPRRIDDAGYRGFIAAIAATLGSALSSAQAHEIERQRVAALAQLDRAKTDFFAGISHELRTPLALMVGPLELLLQARGGSDESGELETLRMAHRNALRLQELVNRLLDFSRIEAGRMQPHLEPTDLAAATGEIAAMFRSAVEGAGLALVIDCQPASRPAWVDRAMWEKIVVNFLSNAYKYTRQGAIEVRLREEDGCAVLQVSDSGCGIAAEHLPRIFDRFYRIEGAPARVDEGSGIGLALVRELVQLHDGAIDVASEPGRGSVFTVVLPLGEGRSGEDGDTLPDDIDVRPWHGSVHAGLDELERLSNSAAAAASTQLDLELPPAAAATCVLVAGDNLDMRAYIARLLAPRWQVQFAGDGMQALAALRERAFDLVISDTAMPGLDGLGLVRALRADAALRAVPVLLLSSHSGEEARLDALAAGADDYLVKPFSARELVARVENQLMRARLHQIEGAINRRLSRVFQQVPAAVALLAGPEHRFEFANPAYEKLVARRGLVGRTVAEVFPELAGQGVFELLDTVYRSGETASGDALRVELRDPASGELREHFFAFVYEPMTDAEGSVNGIAVVAYDVSALVGARRAAEAATRTKDEFIAMLGHELRNPLAPIVTALHLMRLQGGDVCARERAIIERQVQHMVTLIDDLLDVARITRGSVQLQRAPLEIWGVVAKAVETASPLIEQRRHQLSVRVPAHGCKVQGDAVRLVQIVSNLLTNAAKFTEAGGSIAIEARRAGERLLLSVTDNGCGMSREELARAFELFAQGQQGPDRPHGGLGLGLAIAQSLARLHDGELRAASGGRGQGCCFTLELPLLAEGAAAAQPAEPAPESAPQDARCVLVVDDNADAAAMLAALLEAWGHRTCTAHDGPQALQLLRERRVDVALVDIGLPVMDGHELARRIRAGPAGRELRLIALTGYGQDSDRRRSAEAGFDAHLVKPVDAALLARLLA